MVIDNKISITRLKKKRCAMSETKIEKAIPEPTMRRLPLYQSYLKSQFEAGLKLVSCTQIAENFKLTPIQVRKDLALTGIVGKPKVGYEVGGLLKAVEECLGWNNSTEAFLVGVGSLGEALLKYRGFDKYGLNIVAAFDTDPQKVGRDIGGKKIFDLSKFSNLAVRMQIKIGILTVPETEAQRIADQMIKSGIRAIWNFTPVKVIVPESVIIQNENLSASFVVLSKKLRELMTADR